MFNIGDKIVYPIQGAGIIDVIEEKEFKGEMRTYYNISLINNSMKLMLPSNKAENSNMRLISNYSTLDNILLHLNDYSIPKNNINNSNSKERLEANTQKIKSGSLEELVEVIVSLSDLKKEHPLNSSENQLFLKAKRLLIDEMCLVKNITKSEADALLDEKLKLA